MNPSTPTGHEPSYAGLDHRLREGPVPVLWLLFVVMGVLRLNQGHGRFEAAGWLLLIAVALIMAAVSAYRLYQPARRKRGARALGWFAWAVLVLVIFGLIWPRHNPWFSEAVPREYPLPGHGVLKLEIPGELPQRVEGQDVDSMMVWIGDEPGDPVMTIRIKFDDQGDPELASLDRIRGEFEANAPPPDRRGRDYRIKEIRRRGEVAGYEHVLRGSRLDAILGGHPHVIQGQFVVGEAVLLYNMATNDPDLPGNRMALHFVLGAEWVPDSQAARQAVDAEIEEESPPSDGSS